MLESGGVVQGEDFSLYELWKGYGESLRKGIDVVFASARDKI